MHRPDDHGVALLEVARRRAAKALAYVYFWKGSETSQQAAAKAALEAETTATLVVGGNRSGKTKLGSTLAAAWALGMDGPGVQEWARANDLDIRAIPRRPGRVCCTALTGHETLRITLPAVKELLPSSTRWMNSTGHGEPSCRTPGDGFMVFKSNDQGARAFQGDQWDYLWIDEEGDESVYDEARMRLVDRAGRCVLTLTPLKGRTWVWKRFVDHPEPATNWVRLHSQENPHLPQEYLARLLATYSDAEQASRAKGAFAVFEGLVYALSRQHHVIRPVPIPLEWPRYRGLDFGVRNPFCCLWTALDPSDDVLHVYREHYQAGWTLRKHAQAIHRAEACGQCCGLPVLHGLHSLDDAQLSDALKAIENCPACGGTGRGEPEAAMTWADPSGKDERIELARYGISTAKAKHNIRAGINAVAERMRLDAVGRPHILIHSSCSNLIREKEGYKWATQQTKRNQPDLPLDKDNHALDCERYIALGLKMGSFGVA